MSQSLSDARSQEVELTFWEQFKGTRSFYFAEIRLLVNFGANPDETGDAELSLVPDSCA